MITNRRTAALLVALSTALAIPVLAAAPANASGGSQAIESRGTCTGGGTWKLKAKPDGSRLEVEFEVDTNRNGQVWSNTITNNTVTVFSGKRTTLAPSGSYEINITPRNRAGTDTIKARATYRSRVCVGTVKV